MVRGFIDPDKHECYQAVIHVGRGPAATLPQAGDSWEWTGVHWFDASLDEVPDTPRCFVALAVLESMDYPSLARVPGALHKLKACGTLLGAVAVAGAKQAAALYRLWQDHNATLVGPTQDERAVPMIVSVEDRADVRDVLRWCNMFTYAPMMVCADWFDIRTIGSQGHPVRHHRIIADDYRTALDMFGRQSQQAGPVVMTSLVESASCMRLESISEIGEVVDRHNGSEPVITMITCILADHDDSTTELHWLELLPD